MSTGLFSNLNVNRGTAGAGLNFGKTPRATEKRAAERTQLFAAPPSKENTVNSGEEVRFITRPNGQVIPIKDATGGQRLVRKPGTSVLFDPDNNNEPYQIDPRSPKGVRSAFDFAPAVPDGAGKLVKKVGDQVREVGEDTKFLAKQAEAAAKKTAAEQKAAETAAKKQETEAAKLEAAGIKQRKEEEMVRIGTARATLEEADKERRLVTQSARRRVSMVEEEIRTDKRQLSQIEDDLEAASGDPVKTAALEAKKAELSALLPAKEDRRAALQLNANKAALREEAWARRSNKLKTALEKEALAVKTMTNTGRRPSVESDTGINAPSPKEAAAAPVVETNNPAPPILDDSNSWDLATLTAQVTADATRYADAYSQYINSVERMDEVGKAIAATGTQQSQIDFLLNDVRPGMAQATAREVMTRHLPKVDGQNIKGTTLVSNDTGEIGTVHYDDRGVPELLVKQGRAGVRYSPSLLSGNPYDGVPEYSEVTRQFIDEAQRAGEGMVMGQTGVAMDEGMAARINDQWRKQRWGAEQLNGLLTEWQGANEAERTKIVQRLQPEAAMADPNNPASWKLNTRALFQQGKVSLQEARLLERELYGIQPGFKPLAQAWEEYKAGDTYEARALQQIGSSNLSSRRQIVDALSKASNTFLADYYKANGHRADFDLQEFNATRDTLMDDEAGFAHWTAQVDNALQNALGSSAGIAFGMGKFFTLQTSPQERDLILRGTQLAGAGLSNALRDRATLDVSKWWSGKEGGALRERVDRLFSGLDNEDLTASEFDELSREILRGAVQVGNRDKIDGTEKGIEMAMEEVRAYYDPADPRSPLAGLLLAYQQTRDPALKAQFVSSLFASPEEQEHQARVAAFSSANGTISEDEFSAPMRLGFRGGQVAPLQEVLIETISNVASVGMGKLLTSGAKGAVKMREAGQAMNAFQRTALRLEEAGEAFARMGIKDGAAYRNFLVQGGKQAATSGLSEGGEEFVAAFMETGATLGDALAQGLTGMLGGVGLAPVHGTLGLGLNVLSDMQRTKLDNQQVKTWTETWNKQHPEDPVTEQDYRQLRAYLNPAEDQTEALKQAMGELQRNGETVRTLTAQGPPTPDVLAPLIEERDAIMARASGIVAAQRLQVVNAKQAMQEINGIQDPALRDFADAALRARRGQPLNPREEKALLNSTNDANEVLAEPQAGGGWRFTEAGLAALTDAAPLTRETYFPAEERDQVTGSPAPQTAGTAQTATPAPTESQSPAPAAASQTTQTASPSASAQNAAPAVDPQDQTLSGTNSPPASVVGGEAAGPPAEGGVEAPAAGVPAAAAAPQQTFNVPLTLTLADGKKRQLELEVQATSPEEAAQKAIATPAMQAYQRRGATVDATPPTPPLSPPTQAAAPAATAPPPESTAPAPAPALAEDELGRADPAAAIQEIVERKDAEQQQAARPFANILKALVTVFGYKIVDTGIPSGFVDRWGTAHNFGTQLFDKMQPGSEVGQWIDKVGNAGPEITAHIQENMTQPYFHRVWFGHDPVANIGAVVDQFGVGALPEWALQLAKDSTTKSGIPLPGTQYLVHGGLVGDRTATNWLSMNVGEALSGGFAILGTFKLARNLKQGKPIREGWAIAGVGFKLVGGVVQSNPVLILSGIADATMLVAARPAAVKAALDLAAKQQGEPETQAPAQAQTQEEAAPAPTPEPTQTPQPPPEAAAPPPADLPNYGYLPGDAVAAALEGIPESKRRSAIAVLDQLNDALGDFGTYFPGGVVFSTDHLRLMVDESDALNVNVPDVVRSYLGQRPETLTAVMREELIHIAAARVMTSGEVVNLWGSLPYAIQQRVYAGYFAADILEKLRPKAAPRQWSAADAYQMGHEFIRMLVQDAEFQGAITEAVQADASLGERIIAFLRTLVVRMREMISTLPPGQRGAIQEYERRVRNALRDMLGRPPLPDPNGVRNTGQRIEALRNWSSTQPADARYWAAITDRGNVIAIPGNLATTSWDARKRLLALARQQGEALAYDAGMVSRNVEYTNATQQADLAATEFGKIPLHFAPEESIALMRQLAEEMEERQYGWNNPNPTAAQLEMRRRLEESQAGAQFRTDRESQTLESIAPQPVLMPLPTVQDLETAEQDGDTEALEAMTQRLATAEQTELRLDPIERRRTLTGKRDKIRADLAAVQRKAQAGDLTEAQATRQTNRLTTLLRAVEAQMMEGMETVGNQTRRQALVDDQKQKEEWQRARAERKKANGLTYTDEQVAAMSDEELKRIATEAYAASQAIQEQMKPLNERIRKGKKKFGEHPAEQELIPLHRQQEAIFDRVENVIARYNERTNAISNDRRAREKREAEAMLESMRNAPADGMYPIGEREMVFSFWRGVPTTPPTAWQRRLIDVVQQINPDNTETVVLPGIAGTAVGPQVVPRYLSNRELEKAAAEQMAEVLPPDLRDGTASEDLQAAWATHVYHARDAAAKEKARAKMEALKARVQPGMVLKDVKLDRHRFTTLTVEEITPAGTVKAQGRKRGNEGIFKVEVGLETLADYLPPAPTGKQSLQVQEPAPASPPVASQETATAETTTEPQVGVVRTNGDPNIGREWNSPMGRQRIISVERWGGRDNYTVQTLETGAERIYDAPRLEERVQREEYETTEEYRLEKQERDDRAQRQAQAQKRKDEQTEAEQKVLEVYLDAVGLMPMQRAKLKLILETGVSKSSSAFNKVYDGRRHTVVERMVADGYQPKTEQVEAIKEVSRTRFNRMDAAEQRNYEKRRQEAGKKTEYQLVAPTGEFFVITKAEFDYAQWVAAKNNLPTATSEAEPAPTPEPETPPAHYAVYNGKAVAVPGDDAVSRAKAAGMIRNALGKGGLGHLVTPTGEVFEIRHGQAGMKEIPDMPASVERLIIAAMEGRTVDQPLTLAQPGGTATRPTWAIKGGPPAKTDTPATAEAKVEDHLEIVSQTQGQRPAADIKKELLERLEAELAKIPTSVGSDQVPLPEGTERLTIQIPGDGTFTISPRRDTIESIIKRVKRLDTKPTGKGKPETVKVTTPRDTMALEWGTEEAFNTALDQYNDFRSSYESQMNDGRINIEILARSPKLSELTKASGESTYAGVRDWLATRARQAAQAAGVEWTPEPDTNPDTPAPNNPATPATPDVPAAPVVDTKPAKPTTTPKIQDFGQKIGGARKDIWGGLRQKLEADLPPENADITLSKHWPEPNYEKLIADGMDPMGLATFKALRDLIPTKPQSAYKLQQWGKLVRELHGHMRQVMENNGALTPAMQQMSQGLGSIPTKVRLYQALGFPLLLKAKDYGISYKQYSFYRGQSLSRLQMVIEAHIKGRSVSDKRGQPIYRIIDASREDQTALNVEAEIVADLKKLLEEQGPDTASPTPAREAAKAITRYGIYQDRFSKDHFIGRRGINGVVRLKTGFSSFSSARQHLTDHIDAIEAQWDSLKIHPDYRRPINAPRQGPERREGDVTPELFQETFGFRGVEFGNWVANERRQQDLNQAFDALMDLAEAVAVPPRALSLDGSLGLAFGARGTGGKTPAAAHYEPYAVAINLTKEAGPGTLAHEWWHGFDNYFARLDQTGSTEAKALDSFASTLKRGPKNMRQEVLDAFQKITQAIRQSPFAKRSTDLDDARSKPYYGTMIEMTARAFERYVRDRLAENLIASDYLVNLRKDNSPALPTQEEMAGGIRAAYDNLFTVLEKETTAKGVKLYASRPAPIDTAAQAAATSPTNDLPQPTAAQKEAGNYAKGHTRIGGLDISIENPVGSTRSGQDAKGKRWETRMEAHYGYVKGTEGPDGDHLDVFIAPGTPVDFAGTVFVVEQTTPDGRTFDEHKAVFGQGITTAQQARDLYSKHYQAGWQGGHAIEAMPWAQFKRWAQSPHAAKPLEGRRFPLAASRPAGKTDPMASDQGAAQNEEPSAGGLTESEVESMRKPGETIVYSSGGSQFASEDKTVAMAYASNPGFGGDGIIYAASIPLSSVLNNPNWKNLVENAGLDWGAVSSSFDRGNYMALERAEVQKWLRDNEYDAVSYLDDFPDAAKVLFLVNPVAWMPTNIDPFSQRREVLERWGYGVSGQSIRESAFDDLLSRESPKPSNYFKARRVFSKLENEDLSSLFESENYKIEPKLARLAIKGSQEWNGFPDDYQSSRKLLGSSIEEAKQNIERILRGVDEFTNEEMSNALQELFNDAVVNLPQKSPVAESTVSSESAIAGVSSNGAATGQEINNSAATNVNPESSRAEGGAMLFAPRPASAYPTIQQEADKQQSRASLTTRSTPLTTALRQRDLFMRDARTTWADYVSGNIDRIDHYAPGFRDIWLDTERKLSLARAAVNGLFQTLNSRARQGFGYPAWWKSPAVWNRWKRFQAELLPVAARLEASGVDDSGNFIWAPFEMRAGQVESRLLQSLKNIKSKNVGDLITLGGEQLRIGPVFTRRESNATTGRRKLVEYNMLLRPMSPAAQEATYRDFVDAWADFPVAKDLLDEFIMPGMDKVRFQGPRQFRTAEFNRYALRDFFNEWPQELRDQFGALPEMDYTAGYVPEVPIKSTIPGLVGAISELIRPYSSSARRLETRGLRETGDVKNLFEGFQTQLMQAHMEKVRMERRGRLLKAAAQPMDTVPAAEKHKWIPINDAFEGMYDAIVLAKNLDPDKYPAITGALNPAQLDLMRSLVGEAYQLRGKNLGIPAVIFNEMLADVAAIATENLLLKVLNWFVQNFNAASLASLQYLGMNFIGNEIMKMAFMVQQGYRALILTTTGKWADNATRRRLAFATLGYLFKGMVRDRFPLRQERIREVVPRELYDTNHFFNALDGMNLGVIDNLKRLQFGSAFLAAVRSSNWDLGAKVQLAHAMYQAHAREAWRAAVKADPALKNLTGPQKRQWFKDYVANAPDAVHREIEWAAGEWLMNYENTPRWMNSQSIKAYVDPTRPQSAGRAVVSAQFKKLAIGAFIPFIRWSYLFVKRLKRTAWNDGVRELIKGDRREGLANLMALGTLIAAPASLAFLSEDEDDEDRLPAELLGRNRDSEGKDLDPTLRATNRLNASGLARIAATWAGFSEDFDFSIKDDAGQEQDLWLRYRNYPYVKEGIVLGLWLATMGESDAQATPDRIRRSRTEKDPNANVKDAFGQSIGALFGEYFSLGLGYQVIENIHASAAGGQGSAMAADELRGTAIDFATAPVLPHRLLRDANIMLDPVDRRTLPSKSLGYAPGWKEAFMSRIPGLRQSLPMEGRVSTPAVLSSQTTVPAAEVKELLEHFDIPATALQYQRGQGTGKDIFADLRKLRALGAGPQDIGLGMSTAKVPKPTISYPNPATVRQRNAATEAVRANSPFNLLPVNRAAYQKATRGQTAE